MGASGKVLWRATSSRHDWQKGGPAPAVLGAAVRLGLIKGPATVGVDYVTEKPSVSFDTGEELATIILNRSRVDGRMVVRVTGEVPRAWELFLEILPFDHESGWVEGMNTLWLTFDRSHLVERAASDALAEAFMGAHTPADTEYAVIHPYDHWSDFAEAHYRPPVTIGLTFAGVFWASFLGPGHIEEFDQRRLHEIIAPLVRWVDDSGLFIVAAPDLATADAPESEPMLLRLTDEFRAALRADSRWR